MDDDERQGLGHAESYQIEGDAHQPWVTWDGLSALLGLLIPGLGRWPRLVWSRAVGADDYLRISYATSLANIEKGLDRLEKFVKGL